MSNSLTEHQRETLARYFWLYENHRELFSGRPRRPIITEPEILEEFAEEHSVVLGVLAETPYLWLINDLVQSRKPSGETFYHPYLRFIAPPEHAGTTGVVVLATVRSSGGESAESIVLVEQERHATGNLELELPRGFGDPNTPPEAHALQELKSETGYVGTRAEYLGTTLTDSGTTDSSVSFFHVPVTSRSDQEPEPQEAISRIVLLTKEELWAEIDSGAVRDGFTMQALALYARRMAIKAIFGLSI